MDDVSPRILSRLNGYYCREARTLIPPSGPPRRRTRTHMRSNTAKEGRGVDDDVDGMCDAVQRVGARITKRGVPLAELTRVWMFLATVRLDRIGIDRRFF